MPRKTLQKNSPRKDPPPLGLTSLCVWDVQDLLECESYMVTLCQVVMTPKNTALEIRCGERQLLNSMQIS